MLSKAEKTAIIKEYARFEGDTGSVEVKKILFYSTLVLCLISLLYNLSLFLLPDADNIALTNPQLYSQIFSLFH